MASKDFDRFRRTSSADHEIICSIYWILHELTRFYDLHLKDGTVIKVRMTQSEIRDMLGDSFLPVSRGLIVNVEFIRQLGPKSCMLRDGREILLSRGNMEQIHSAYAAYVFSQLSKRDGAFPERVKR